MAQMLPVAAAEGGLPWACRRGRLAPLEVSLAEDLPDLSHLALPGAEIAVRVTPNARREGIVAGDVLRISVTVVPEDGRATAAAQALLARALGVAKTRLTLMRGAKARDKLFRLD